MIAIAANIYLVTIGRLQPVLVEVTTDEGLVGLGEAGIAYGIGASAAASMIKEFVELKLLGCDPFRIEALWSDMYDHSFWAKGGGPVVFSAMSAIEQALWDIKGKALGTPVYELLGGLVRKDVPLYANGWSYHCVTPDDYARAAERPLREGYRALKCYPLAVPGPGGGIRHVSQRSVDRAFLNGAAEKVKALRRAVGDEVDLMVDLSGGLTTAETIRLCHFLEDLDICFIEEPADPFDLPALEQIARDVHVPVALGERIYTRYGFRPILESRCAEVLQPDVGNTGGIAEAKKIAAMAEAYSARIQLHVCGGPVATAAALQVEASLPNFLMHEVYPYRNREHFEIVDHAPEDDICRGRMPIPDSPGLGISLMPARVERFLYARCEL